jgi:amphi-Trp domain-containing protein
MARRRVHLDRPASPDEVATELIALVGVLRRGLLARPGEGQPLRLAVPAELKVELAVRVRGDRGRLSIELSWKRDPDPITGPGGRPRPAG